MPQRLTPRTLWIIGSCMGVSLFICYGLDIRVEHSDHNVASDVSFDGGGGGGGGNSSFHVGWSLWGDSEPQVDPEPMPQADTTRATSPEVSIQNTSKADAIRTTPKIVPGKPTNTTTIRFDDDAPEEFGSNEGFGGFGKPGKPDPKMGKGGMGMRSASSKLDKKKKRIAKKKPAESSKRDTRQDHASLDVWHNPSSKKTRKNKKPANKELSREEVRPFMDHHKDDAKKPVAEKKSTPQPEPDVPPRSASGPDESYDNHGVNPMTKVSKDRLSTFSIDVDTGSYTIARRKLDEGIMPPAASVRVEEFVNYFDYDYPDPEEGAFSVSFDGAPSPFRSNVPRHLIRIGVQGDRLAEEAKKPLHLVFLVDVSGSMNTRDKLGLVKKSLQVLTKNLDDDDTVALVTYAAHTKVAMRPTKASESIKILEGILNLSPGGGTAMGNGMETAYKMAIEAVKPGHVSRVVVLSDGDANIGNSTMEDVLEGVQTYVDEGVTLSTIGFGMGNYKDNLMEQLANKGNGNYYYIDSKAEAEKVFGEQLVGTMQVIAKDVKIQVEFDPEVVESYRLVGYENRDIADKDFRDDRVDAGEIGAGHSVTALYEVEFTRDGKDLPADAVMAIVRIRHKQPDGITATEQAFPLRRDTLLSSLLDASPGFQFAVAVVGFAEQLRGSPYVRDFGFAQILALTAKLEEPSDRQREFIALVERAKAIRRDTPQTKKH